MNMREIVAELDNEISLLAQVRATLMGTNHAAPKRGPNSAAGRKRIADAQRKRWAKKKAAK